MGHASMTSRKHQFLPYGEVDTAVRAVPKREGEGRDERRKQVRRKKKLKNKHLMSISGKRYNLTSPLNKTSYN